MIIFLQETLYLQLVRTNSFDSVEIY